MATLIFNAAEVRELVEHCKAAPQHDTYYGEKVGPSLLLVGDRGVYLMSNGKPKLPNKPDNNGKIEEGHRVSYAKGTDPRTDEDWWDAKRDLFGGDDGAVALPIAWFEKALAIDPKTIKIKLTATKIAISV